MTAEEWLDLPLREIVVLLVVVIVGWTAKPAIRWVVREITAAVIDDVGDRLQKRWLEDFNSALDELRPNGGGSIKDQVASMHRTMGELQRAMETLHTDPPCSRHRPTPPEGTPDGF